MAIFRLQVTPITREGGHSSVAAAAYRAGEKLRDDRTNELHNHSRRKDVTHSEILLPAHLSGENMDWARNRASLWNEVESVERRKNARVATEVQVTLPFELPPESRLAIARTFSQELANNYKVAVDLAVHDPRPAGDPRNFHAHMLMTTREVSPAGLGAKAGLDMDTRERIRLGLPSLSQEFTGLRARWATLTNEALKEANLEARVDHRSLAEQGIDREPKPHIPFAAFKLERAGKYSEVAESIRADYNARVQARLGRAVERERAVQVTVPGEVAATAMGSQNVAARQAAMQTNGPEDAAAAAVAAQPIASKDTAAREAVAQTIASKERAAREVVTQTLSKDTPARDVANPAKASPDEAARPAATRAIISQEVVSPAPPSPDAPAPVAPRRLEDIRREARENWLRMRAEQGRAVSGTSNDSRSAERGATQGRATDHDYQP